MRLLRHRKKKPEAPQRCDRRLLTMEARGERGGVWIACVKQANHEGYCAMAQGLTVDLADGDVVVHQEFLDIPSVYP